MRASALLLLGVAIGLVAGATLETPRLVVDALRGDLRSVRLDDLVAPALDDERATGLAARPGPLPEPRSLANLHFDAGRQSVEPPLAEVPAGVPVEVRVDVDPAAPREPPAEPASVEDPARSASASADSPAGLREAAPEVASAPEIQPTLAREAEARAEEDVAEPEAERSAALGADATSAEQASAKTESVEVSVPLPKPRRFEVAVPLPKPRRVLRAEVPSTDPLDAVMSTIRGTLEPTPDETPRPQQALERRVVQVSATPSREGAERLLRTLRDEGYSAYLLTGERRSGAPLYRVRVRPKGGSADGLASRLDSAGYATLVLTE